MVFLMRSILLNPVVNEATVLETVLPEFVHIYDSFGLDLAQLGQFSR